MMQYSASSRFLRRRLSPMSVAAVIGATGFVGSHIVNHLLSKGYSVRCSTRSVDAAQWLKRIPNASSDKVSLHPLSLTSSGPSDEAQMDSMLRGPVSSVFFCAGFETQAPETIDFMVNNALATIRAARRNEVQTVVITSSGGSTNPPGLPSDTMKSEILHWSDPEQQKSANKWSPAAKTLMEINSLLDVGRNQQNEIVDADKAKASPRLVIMNPNLILGPQLQPGEVKGNSLPWIVKILKKESMAEQIPNDSMSVIDVRDLVALHVAAAEKSDASGRYWGVNKSFKWEEILTTFQKVLPSYTPPPRFEGEAKLETQFDHTRKESLGVPLRSLEETLQDLVAFMQERKVID